MLDGGINIFRMNACEQDLIDLLDKGYPVPIGILTDDWRRQVVSLDYVNRLYREFIAHDPFGCMSLAAGLRDWPEDGKNVMYSRNY